MNFKKILTVILLIKTTPILYSLGNEHFVTSIIVNETEIRDFKDDSQLAHEWGKEKWSDWGKKINLEERRSLEAYTAYSSNINDYLRKNQGILHESIDDKLVVDEIQKIDRALEKGKIPEDTYVYRRTHESMFGLGWSKLRNENSSDKQINFAGFNKIKSEYENKDFIEHGFLSTSLSKAPTKYFNSTENSLLLKIKVPEGLNGAYLAGEMGNKAETEILIARGYTIRYESFSIIIEGNHNVVKVEASLRKT